MITAILIPAYNEEATIGDVIKKIRKEHPSKTYIIVVDDGSSDRTSIIAKESGADFVLNNKKNFGRSMSEMIGVYKSLELGSDIVVTMDADMQHDPEEISKLITPIIDGKADVTIGNRFNSSNDNSGMSLLHRFGNRFFTTIVNLFTGLKFNDTQCGFRAFSREAALRLHNTSSHSSVQEQIIDLVNKNMVVGEVNLSNVPGVREHGKSKIVKNPFVYGLKSISLIFRIIKNYYPLRFFGFFSFIALLFSLITGATIITSNPETRPEFFDWLGFEYTLVSLIFGLSLLAIALLADINSSVKLAADENLYYSKKTFFDATIKK